MVFIPRLTYLDHNATTPLAKEARRAMKECLDNVYGNPSSLHTEGRKARGYIDNVRKSLADVLGCEPETIYFTSGGTEANNTIIKGVFRAAGKGHIITSKIEHESVLGACAQVVAAGGEVTYLSAGKDGIIPAQDVKAAIRPDTILISIMHANNETGAIQPVEEIGQIANESGIPFHTDAVQTFGKIPVLVEEIGCEFLTITAHKINGPKGVGAFYWRGKTRWEPLVSGGSQEQYLRAGTEGVHQIAGLGAAAELIVKKSKKEFERLRSLRALLIDGVKKVYPGVKINEAPEVSQLPGSINLTFPDKDGLRLLAGLDCYKVCVSIGSACTADKIEPSHVILGMGLGEEYALSTIRISMGVTTGARDVKYFLSVLREVLKGDPAGFSYLDPAHLDKERIISGKTFIIDLRFKVERMLSPSVPGAKLWSNIGFEKYFKQIPYDREVVLMCGTGIFSLSAGYRLAKSGHPDVKVVYGGYAAWSRLHPNLIRELKNGQK